MEILIGQIT